MRVYQQGSVLIVSLLLLLIITIVGVSGVSNSMLGDRLASNQRQLSLAFMAAESGLVNAKQWFDNASNLASWGDTSATIDGINDLAVTGSINDLSWEIESVAFNGDEVTIVSCGTVADTGVNRCLTSIYVKGSGGGNLAAMNIIGNIKTFDTANSNSFQIIGAKDSSGNAIGPALATNTKANADLMLQDINKKGRIDNYIGGIAQVEFDDPFGDPEKMNDFITGIKNEWSAMAANDPRKGTAPTNMGAPSTSTAPAVMKITYYEGNLDLKGTSIGAGILVVNGNLTISGNNIDFEGLVIVTGQSFVMKGGGNKDMLGALVFANPILNSDSEWSFGRAEATFEFDVSGGGNASFTYDSQVLKKAWTILGDSNIAKTLWQVEESVSGSASESKMYGWNEYIKN
jgi:Tfp pilus assembly protein PilX